MILDLVRGDYGLGELLKSVKLDMADVNEHIALEKSDSWKQFRITPDAPAAFEHAVDLALAEPRRER